MSQNSYCSRRHPTILIVGVATLWIVALGLTDCSVTNAPEPEEGVADVRMQGIAFVPKEVTIQVGERVRWTNGETLLIHTTTSGDPTDGSAGDLWNSGDLAPGESFVHQFDEIGEYIYFCKHHPNAAAMRGAKVIVQP